MEQMKDLTDEFRMGFGSFIDKPVLPFADKLKYGIVWYIIC